MVLTEIPTCDGKPMVALAKRVPMFKDSRGGAVNQGRLQTEALMQVLDKLVKYPGLILQAHGVIYSKDFATVKPVCTSGDAEWSERVTTIGKLNRGWVANWLLARHSEHGLKAEHLDALETADADNIPLLFSFELQLPLSCLVPKSVKGTSAMTSDWLTARANIVGPRMQSLLAKNKETPFQGVHNACYSITFEGATAVAVTHISGASVNIKEHKHIIIYKGFKLVDGHSDVLARVVLHPAVHVLHQLFPAEAQFRQHLVESSKDKSLHSSAEDVRKKHAETDAEREKAQQLSKRPILETALKAQRLAATAKAKKAMEEKKKSRTAKRTIQLV
eukprot:5653298-Amphidinium_carterae.1